MSGGYYIREYGQSKAREMANEVAGWLWGTVQGEFNEEQTASQIIVDSVISMIPIVGEGTDIRDIIAVIIRMVKHPEKRKEVLEWAMLIVLVAALIPVFGGAIKLVGRGLLKLSKRGDELAEIAKEAIELLNRAGVGNAEQWLCDFSFAKCGQELFSEFMELTSRICGALEKYVIKMGWVLPTAFIKATKELIEQIGKLQEAAYEMWGKALSYLDELLEKFKTKIKPDGTGASKETEHSIPVTEKTPTRPDEAEMKGGDDAVDVAADRINRGLTLEDCPDEFAAIKKRFTTFDEGVLETFCEKPKISKVGQIWRVFGKGESNPNLLNKKVGDTDPTGAYFGVGASPQNAKQWREECAVMDIWNSDKYICEISATDDIFEGVVGKVARQDSDPKELGALKISQHLDGDGQQAWFDRSGAIGELQDAINAHPGIKAYRDGIKASHYLGAEPFTFKIQGHDVTVTLRPTGWDDANFIHGWEKPALMPDFSRGIRNLGYEELKSKTPETDEQ